MTLFGKTLDRDLIVVAEAGVNHEGSVDAAMNLVRLAHEAGADAVKFQSYTPSRFISTSRPEAFERVSQFRLDEDAHRKLAAEGRRLGIPVFSSAITDDVIPMLDELFPAIKVASGDIDFEPTIRAAARTGKPVIISTGNATVEEIDRAVGWVRSEVGVSNLSEHLILLQCTAAYPAPVDHANVAMLPWLKARYGVPVGYSNHVIGMEACLAAVALGAAMLEIHFTDRKEGRAFRDHQLSMTRDELRALIEAAQKVRAAIGSPVKAVQESERVHHLDIRKGVVAAHALKPGQVIGEDDLSYARPATHFPASARNELIGRKVTRPLEPGNVITRDDLA